uniref:Uncharacterized protein n=1 Tax=Skeletonema marinoi TaxID=267567 RepID=A0A7S2P610_9STRA|mmetsp:Transcript_13529/g.22753  ORF Transcript_13529/g.22753 Transcript_13529/m.22753 type:complete len:180 (+) Transcript_13529:70-609(+)
MPRLKLTASKVFRAVRALARRKVATRDVEPEEVLAKPSYEGRMILFLSICLVVSIIVVAIADKIERRLAARGDELDSVDDVSEKRAMESNGGGCSKHPSPPPMSSTRDSHAKSHRDITSSPAATSNGNDEESTFQELDDLVNDIVNSSAKMQKEKEVNETTRQFDEIIKYDNFLKLIKS